MTTFAEGIRVGIVLPSREVVMAGTQDAGLLVEVAERAERAGFDSVWIGESLFHRPRFEPLAVLSAVAARTTNVGIGSAILIAAQRHPLQLAQTVASTDRIAKGRVVLGVGSGWIQPEFDALGVPFDQRVGRLRDTIAICRAVWRGEPLPETRYWDLPDVEIFPRPVREGGPPVWIGGAGPQALKAAARYGDGWVPTSPSPEAFADGWAQIQQLAAEAGRDSKDIDTAAYLTINVTDDIAAGEKEASAYAEGYYGIPYDVISKFQGYFVGDLDATKAWLQGFVDAGVTHLLLRFATITETLTQVERATALLPGRA